MGEVEAAWRLARAQCARALGEGALGVAVTGSLARGDWAQGSDVDLWVLWPREERREGVASGLHFTWLCQRPDEALDFDSLARFEVPSIRVLADPHRHFRRIRAAHRELAAELHRSLFSETVLSMLGALDAAGRGAVPARIRYLREVALRAAVMELFLRRGQRVAKLRQLAQELSPAAFECLRAALGVPWSSRQWSALLSASARAYAQASRLLGSVEAPDKWLALRLVQADDAALQLRRHFDENVVQPAAARGLSLGPALLAHRALLAGRGRGASSLRQVAQAVEQLFEHLRVGRYLRPRQAWKKMFYACTARLEEPARPAPP